MERQLARYLAKMPAFGLFLRPTATNLKIARGKTTMSVPRTTRTEADLPQVTLMTLLYRIIFKGYYNRVHELQLYEKQLYGPMFKINTGAFQTISICSADLMEEIFRKDEKFPSRGDMSLWTEYRDMKGLGYGPLTQEGEKWYKLRSVLKKRMLNPKDIVKYEDMVNEVLTDFIKRIYHLRKMSSTGDLVPNMSNELYLFSLEGISRILFETRIGCLENKIPAETQDFIDSIGQMFLYNMLVLPFPTWTRNYLPFWRRFVDGWDGIFRFVMPIYIKPGLSGAQSGAGSDCLIKLNQPACKLIDRKMEDIQRCLDTGQEGAGGYLSYLLSNTNIGKTDIYGSVAEMLVGGVDTTSNTMLWALYLLSQNPKAQDTLYLEVTSIVKGDKIPTAEDINKMPYLKAVIKETLRVYPVVPMNGRLFSRNDIIIGGHYFPKKTAFTFYHYAISHDETIFPEPSLFKPERWLRDGRERPNSFSSIPFGFGVRGCIGKRIAELEMHLALARIIKLFEVKLDPSVGEVKAVTRIMLVADRQVNFQFLERKPVLSSSDPLKVFTPSLQS